jgi:hypothetical protein
MCIKKKAAPWQKGSGDTAKRRYKDNHFQGQIKRAFKAFYSKPKTMLMVSVETGILRANLCRYVAEWQKQDCIRKVTTKDCKISKHRAGFYSTNPAIVKLSKNDSHAK